MTVRRVSVWRNRYEVRAAGRVVTTWDGAFWRNGGAFTLDGLRYEVRGGAWGTRFTMLDPTGGTVATAERVGRKRWTVTAGGQVYAFHRASLWGHRQELRAGDRTVGVVRRVSAWRNDVDVDLPGVPLPLQVFVLGVVITMWDNQAAAAAS